MEFNVFDSIKIGLASPDQIRAWSYGEVTASEVTVGENTKMDLVPVTIQNLRGATLPSTGGIGKTVLITAGAVLAVVAGVGLVAKFRASRMK